MTTELNALHEHLQVLCGQFGLACNKSDFPVKVGPDCYYFYATRLEDNCRRQGYCKEEKFYALTGGRCVDIMDGDRQRLIKTPKGV